MYTCGRVKFVTRPWRFLSPLLIALRRFVAGQRRFAWAITGGRRSGVGAPSMHVAIRSCRNLSGAASEETTLFLSPPRIFPLLEI